MSQAIQKITEDGEIINTEVTTHAENGNGNVGTLVRAEIDMQIATAHAYPRSIKRAAERIMDLTTYDEQAAAEAVYAVPRAGKAVRGASVRLAETVAQQWGNNRSYARVTQIDRVQKIVIAEGVYHDLETNALTLSEVRRSIVDKRGIIYSPDMINNTCNAACSIAKRNAILRGIPAVIWRRAYEAAEKTIRGDIKTLTARRDAAIKAFATYGVTPDQIYAALDVHGAEEVTLEHIPTLQGMYSAVKNGDATVEELFPSAKPQTTSTDKLNELVQKQVFGEKPPEQKPEPAKAETAAAPATATREETGAGAADAPDGGREWDMLKGYEPTEAARKVAAAEQAGWDAHKAGLTRKAVPGELRDKGREAEAQAWHDGWDRRAQELKTNRLGMALTKREH